MAKRLFFYWNVTVKTGEGADSTEETVFGDKQEITEAEMLEIFKNRPTVIQGGK